MHVNAVGVFRLGTAVWRLFGFLMAIINVMLVGLCYGSASQGR